MNKKKHNFCCDSMFKSIEEDNIIDYDPTVREYGILVGEDAIKILSFCPWCGTKLPENLVKKLFKVLLEEYSIPLEEADIYNYTNVPDEFKTDEWWKKRGL